MSNILIIKHGSLGDLIQANGAIKDIKNFYKNRKVFLLTSQPYAIFMSECPYIDGVIIDKRLPRWNLFYLNTLKKNLKRYNFSKVFDLQNSNRTKFYKKFIINKEVEWSSSETVLEPGQKKSDFDKDPVLERMELQLKKSGIETEFTRNVNIEWAIKDVSRLIKQYANNEYILLFPFCSKKHQNKKWPYFKELIVKLKQDYKNKFPILIVPGPNEIKEANTLNAKVVTDNQNPVDLKTLISLISNAKFILANDTGPAHIASHLDKAGLVLFGSHTSARKVSIENYNFKALTVKNLKDLNVDTVISEIKSKLN
ncbi:lipopolysaccharide heptosyltransferase family protein [Pelagibacteraceae bacterium]|jgi:ADP-heptose:LPS heptosyltransferase|nr:lipopolysaccharide heptosyltransferase family protein [Pelagibacteraceae bacterium]MDC1130740.1 glycosyltransferase family 9 protein [Pelagibacteraceae bacterium]